MARPRWPLFASAAMILVLPLADEIVLPGLRGVGYAVCHQLPDHSLFAAGNQYPLCARCTGIYLGFLTGLAGLAIQGRLNASRLPAGTTLALLLFAIGAMVADGLNSLLASSPDTTLLYSTTNLVRLGTGLASGTALALLLMPLVNEALWRKPDLLRSADEPFDLLGFGVLAAITGLIIYSQEPLLYYPLALASGLGVVAALAAAGTVLGAALLRRERRAASLRDASAPVLAGITLAALSMAALGLLRAQFGISLGI
jgi:uncharacterized membrane protein